MAARSRSKAGRAKRLPKRIARSGLINSPQPAHHEALAASLALGRAEAFEAALRLDGEDDQDAVSGQRIKALHAVVHESFDLFSDTLVQLELEPPLACKQGCIHCCYNQVALTEPEALILGLHLLETRDKQALMTLSAKTAALVEELKGKSWREIGMERHKRPCLFLEDGTCSIYPVRPMSCRGWNSVNADMCLQSNLSGDALTPIENHSVLLQFAESIQKGMLHGSTAIGLEAGFLLMVRAVSLLLEGGAEQGLLTCTSDWLSGKPFFGRKRTW